MSTPKNHHFLSQVLLKKFLDSEGKLNYYSKTEDSITNKEYSRFDFADEYLNSIIDDNGEIDHKSVEDNLNHNFERDFNRYYESFFSALKSDNHELLTDSIKFMIRLGIIGDMRTPEHHIETQKTIFGGFEQIRRLADSKLQQELEEFYNSVSPVKNKLPVDYNEVAEGVQELMGDCIYSVFIADDDEYFFLPDNSAVTIRSKLEPDIEFNGEILESESRPIATVIFPINSKTIIVSQSAKICPQKSHGIYNLRSDAVYTYNKMFLDSARDKVICAKNEYLRTFISNYDK
jgi:hypothetical protein